VRSAVTLVGLIWLATCHAQNVRTEGVLWIQVDESGHQTATLNLVREAPPRFVEAFAEAVGCSPADLRHESQEEFQNNRPHVQCIPAVSRTALKSNMRWSLARLNGKLAAAGVTGLEVYIMHHGNGIAHITPAMESTRGMFGWSHHLSWEDGSLPDIRLETGFEPGDAWLLLSGAILMALSPLTLLAVSGAIPTIQAAVRALIVLVVSGWLWIVLATEAPALIATFVPGLPGPRAAWAAAALALPMLAAIWLANLILGPKYAKLLTAPQAAMRCRLLLSSGVAWAGLFLLVVGMVTSSDSLFTFAGAGLIVFCTGIVLRFRAARGTSQPLGEGPLMDSVRQLAVRAGTQVKAVKLILSGSTPAAFAGRDNTILLSYGLLRELSRSEVDAIVAHEISHLRHRHMKVISVALAAIPAVVAASFVVRGVVLWAPLTIPPCFLALMAIRRRQERTADADAACWTGGPEAMIRGLARASRGNQLSLHWSRWVGLVLPHPPMTARFEALAVTAGLSPGRVEELVSAADYPPQDRYEAPSLAHPANAISAPQRARLKFTLGLVARIYPISYSIAIPLALRPSALHPMVLAAGELVCGCGLFYWIYEGIVTRARSKVRSAMSASLIAQGAGQPGFFVGFSPSSEPALYDGMYDFEWGFVAFEGDWVVLRTGGGAFSARRSDIARIWLHTGPASWTAKPMVSFELAGDVPRGFSMRPFDNACGLMASSAARKLLAAALAWHRATAMADNPAPGLPLCEYPNPARSPDRPYPWPVLIKGLMQFGAYVASGVSLLQLQFGDLREWNPGVLLTSIVVVWGLMIFQVWPALRRSTS